MGGIEELSSFCSFLILEVLTERDERNKGSNDKGLFFPTVCSGGGKGLNSLGDSLVFAFKFFFG